jgi:DNA-binding MarR family transcriptional regulator
MTTASTLSRLAATGPKRLGELAEDEGVTQPAMTQLVSRLQGEGLVERRPHPDDRRVVMVHISTAGRRLIREVRTRRAHLSYEVLRALPVEDTAAIAAALPAFSRLIELVAPTRTRRSRCLLRSPMLGLTRPLRPARRDPGTPTSPQVPALRARGRSSEVPRGRR